MKVMCLNTLTKSRTWLSLSRLLVVATACCGVPTTSLAQDSWSVWGVPSSGSVQPTTYETAVTDLNVGPSDVVGQDNTIVYEDGAIGSELWDPTALGPDCGYSCPPAWRLDMSYVLLQREGADGLTLSSAFALDGHRYKEGLRATRAQHYDCLDAFEITYIGPFEWSTRGSVSGAGLNFLAGASGGVTLNSFNNATLHSQAYRTEFNSLELNSKWVGWDVFTQTFGLRYWNVKEDFTFGSTSAAGDGIFILDADNHALGLQYGIEMYFPVGRWTTETWMKGGLFGNFVDAGAFLADAGAVQFANSDKDLDLAVLAEFGLDLSYRLRPNVRLHTGYEIWWLYGAAFAPQQLQGTITPATGTSVHDGEDTWFHGGTVGIEVIW